MRHTLVALALLVPLAACTPIQRETTSGPTAAPTARPNGTSFPGDGVYKVGADIKPGEYKTSGSSDCSYSILESPNTSTGVDDYNQTPGQARVRLKAGKYFDTQDCSDWVLTK